MHLNEQGSFTQSIRPRWPSARKVREGETTDDLFAFLPTRAERRDHGKGKSVSRPARDGKNAETGKCGGGKSVNEVRPEAVAQAKKLPLRC